MSDQRDPTAPVDPPMASSEAAMPDGGATAAAMAAPMSDSLVPPSAEEMAALAAATAAAIPVPRPIEPDEAAVQAADAAQAGRRSGRRVRVGRFFVRMATFR
jgi:hypothetical protein